jgi:hypothetical protein
VPNATVTLNISEPEFATITSGPSDATGVAEATWNTSAPNKRGNGGTALGDYTVTTSNVEATGYTWDNVGVSAGFTVDP